MLNKLEYFTIFDLSQIDNIFQNFLTNIKTREIVVTKSFRVTTICTDY